MGNDFLLVSQMTVTGALYTVRPDLIGFVNGLPLVVVELKKPGVPAKQAFDDNLTSYKHPQNGIPDLFWYNALLMASNGIESRVGTLTADWERFFEWKRVEREDEPRRVSLEVMLRGVCDPSRLLDLVENFTLFSEERSGLRKMLAQNHQVLGVNKAIPALLEARAAGHGRGGVFWHTQGAGKSLSMVFFAQKILRHIEGNWTFVVVTDRVELDDQIAKTFKVVGAVSDQVCHAGSGAELRTLLRGNHRYVFTLIHKFQTPEMLCDRRDVIVITDEAHRSQYDTLAVNMRAALPKALFVAFTGTPLIVGEERTRDVFGDYVSIYDFQQSVEDHATVRLFYENRTPELKLHNPTSTTLSTRLSSRPTSTRSRRSASNESWGASITSSPVTTGWRRSRRMWSSTSSGGDFRARRWSSPSIRPPPSGCTTRCERTGRPSVREWRASYRACPNITRSPTRTVCGNWKGGSTRWRRPTWPWSSRQARTKSSR